MYGRTGVLTQAIALAFADLLGFSVAYGQATVGIPHICNVAPLWSVSLEIAFDLAELWRWPCTRNSSGPDVKPITIFVKSGGKSLSQRFDNFKCSSPNASI